MWVSAIPELVGQLLVQVLYPGLFDLASKKVFMMHRQCARYTCKRFLPFLLRLGRP